jgi:hypothetical protein
MNFTQKKNPLLSSFLILSLVFSGCVRYRPHTTDRTSFMERAQTQTRDNLTVTLTVLSNKEAEKSLASPFPKEAYNHFGSRLTTTITIPTFLSREIWIPITFPRKRPAIEPTISRPGNSSRRVSSRSFFSRSCLGSDQFFHDPPREQKNRRALQYGVHA